MSDCVDLAVSRQWLPEVRKWELLFALGKVYGARLRGELVGTVVSTSFGSAASAISMMLVAERLQRQGIGAQLMRHALTPSEESGTFLAATSSGRPLYERIGFRSVGQATVFVGRIADLPAAPTSRPAEPADLTAIRALDCQVTGLERTPLIDRLPTFCHQVRVALDGDRIVGFAGAWSNVGHSFIGPVIADSTDIALGLIQDVAAAENGDVRLELPTRHRKLLQWARTQPLEERFSTTVMERGPVPQGQPERLFAPIMLALG